MSRSEWEHGTITIPAKELPPLHKTLREWQNAFHEEVRAKAIELHKTINTRSIAKYRTAIAELERKLHARENSAPSTPSYGFAFFGYGRVPATPSPQEKRAGIVEDAALEVLSSIQYHAATGKKGIHQPTVEDVSRYAPAATNRTKIFRVGDEGTISFEKNHVTWDVPSNNRAVEHAAEHPLHDVFFDALGKVHWTRGSGGTVVGNDEYNQDARGEGGGGNYVTRSFGPGASSHVRRAF